MPALIEDLVLAAKNYYTSRGARFVRNFFGADAQLANSLPLRPEAIAKYDGMEHLIYAIGEVKEATFRLLEPVVLQLTQNDYKLHIALVVDVRPTQADVKRLSQLKLGLLHADDEHSPSRLLPPHLIPIQIPAGFKMVNRRVRPRAESAITKIKEDDVCVGVMDLVQVVEDEIKRKDRAWRALTFGQVLNKAKKAGTISDVAYKAGIKINRPRIIRAHPGSHTLRRSVVKQVDHIMDSCFNLLFYLG